ncbi:Hsp20/alpha crystallin family protein [Staphylospora marina]|uniref:Hsp20/alpha crystallin family protein n=1 Tax=Staphylospora marina TaxID=2490858 RepID=UPI0013DE15F1|nr:Hsp20/alpha crystallin family protein [Staphylospora marina]
MKTRKTAAHPWQELVKRFLGEDFFEDVVEAATRQDPKTDVYHGPGEVIVVMDLPGLENVKSLKIKVEGEQLRVTGRLPSPYEGYQIRMVERKAGEFEKVIPLGATVSSKRVIARYRRGVLELRFRKIPGAQAARESAPWKPNARNGSGMRGNP